MEIFQRQWGKNEEGIRTPFKLLGSDYEIFVICLISKTHVLPFGSFDVFKRLGSPLPVLLKAMGHKR